MTEAPAASASPGAVTPDSCSVEVYRRLPALAEPEIVHGALPDGAAPFSTAAGATCDLAASS